PEGRFGDVFNHGAMPHTYATPKDTSGVTTSAHPKRRSAVGEIQCSPKGPIDDREHCRRSPRATTGTTRPPAERKHPAGPGNTVPPSRPFAALRPRLRSR